MKGSTKHRTKRFLASAVAFGVSSSALGGVPLYWDPDPVLGIQGGNGAWNTSNSNWNNSGVASVWFNSHDDTAIFGGTAGGVVQMTSAITAAAIEFDTLGYSIAPAPQMTLTISSGSVVANVDVSIAEPISTPGEFYKSGAGTLTLLAPGTIRGTINLLAGTLAYSSDAMLGGAGNDIRLAGGALRLAGNNALTLQSGHTVMVDAAGGRIDTPNAELTLDTIGQLTGGGVLTKTGADTLKISRPNVSFAGSVNIAAGTLTLLDPQAVAGRPIALSGGTLLLRNDYPSDFQSAVTVSADSAITIDHVSSLGMIGQSHAVGDVAINAGATLTVGSPTRNFLRVGNLALGGGLQLNNSGVMVTGALSGAGAIAFVSTTQPPELFASGLIFANGKSQTIGNSFSAVGPGPVVGVAGGTIVNYTGAWSGGQDGGRSAVVLHDGGKFVMGAGAHLNTLSADVTTSQAFMVIGNGVGNSFELDGGFVADRTLGGTVADGFGSLEVRDAQLVTHSSASLPVVNKNDGFGGKHRAGTIIFSGTSGARWVIDGADQQYDGGVTINSSATIQTNKNFSHNGSVNHKFDGIFQIPLAGTTLTKEGAGSLVLNGDQGYAPGTIVQVNAGLVRFNTDPGAGWYAGNYARDAQGNVISAPPATGSLGVVAASGATIEFAAAANHVDSIEVQSGGVARLIVGSHAGDRSLIAHSLLVSGSGKVDLGNGLFIVDYNDAPSPLAKVASLIKSGAITSGAPGQTLGIAYGESADFLHIAGNQTSLISGQTVDATSIIVEAALAGDANLDGRVNFADFQRFELGFGLANQGWSRGDFNADGLVNAADLQILLGNFGKTFAAQPEFGQPIPEPSGLFLAPLMLAFCSRKRRL